MGEILVVEIGPGVSVCGGVTYKSKTQEHTFYTTINHDDDGNVFEIFVRLDDQDLFEMITLVTRLVSMLMQAGVDPMVIAKDLQDVYSPVTRHIIPGTTVECPSIVARIGLLLEQHLERTE